MLVSMHLTYFLKAGIEMMGLLDINPSVIGKYTSKMFLTHGQTTFFVCCLLFVVLCFINKCFSGLYFYFIFLQIYIPLYSYIVSILYIFGIFSIHKLFCTNIIYRPITLCDLESVMSQSKPKQSAV